MAITDIDISETLEAGAPSIKYTGNRDPNQMMMTSQPNPEAEMNDLSIFFFGKSLNELTDDELEYLNIQMQDRYGSRKKENSMMMASMDANERALERIYEDLLEEGMSPEEAAKRAREIFNERAMADGGRVQYGLGSLVKKIGKGIKKIVKSPVGKTALLAAAGFGIPGTSFGGLFGRAAIGGQATGLLGKAGIQAALPSIFGVPGGSPNMPGSKSIFGKILGGSKMGMGSKIGIGTALATYLGSQGMEEEQIEEVQRDPNKLRPYLRDLFKKLNPNLPDGQIEEMVETNVSEYATGGRVGLADGFPNMDEYMYRRKMMELMNRDNKMREEYEEDKRRHKVKEQKTMVADGGRIGLALGSEDTAQAASILGNLPLRQNAGGITELDLRETGGFIPPVGVKEKADDVPAMLSNNEFVFTADAVRAAGGGSVNKGAQILYDKMKQLESKVV
tara:strand:+ start:10669 stop:12015 length:1347 start_codon:yes stop_codon:yes gene_type:complete